MKKNKPILERRPQVKLDWHTYEALEKAKEITGVSKAQLAELAIKNLIKTAKDNFNFLHVRCLHPRQDIAMEKSELNMLRQIRDKIRKLDEDKPVHLKAQVSLSSLLRLGIVLYLKELNDQYKNSSRKV